MYLKKVIASRGEGGYTARVELVYANAAGEMLTTTASLTAPQEDPRTAVMQAIDMACAEVERAIKRSVKIAVTVSW